MVKEEECLNAVKVSDTAFTYEKIITIFNQNPKGELHNGTNRRNDKTAKS